MSKTKTKTNSNNSKTENNTQRIGRQADSSTAQVRTTRQVAQPVTQTVPTRQATPARQPVTITVRSTGEEINRVLIERSGYNVVRYDRRYHVVRGTSRVAFYILGHDDTDDVLGNA
jgi:hypothetical protein